MTKRFQMRQITHHFAGVMANYRVDFDLMQGEIHALLGENGAGKSTLMKIAAGIFQPDSGEIYIDGQPVRIRNPAHAIRVGIGMVHQHFNLVPVMSVTENIILGSENVGRWPYFLSPARAVSEIIALSKRCRLDVDPFALVKDLPVGVGQRVEILKVLRLNPRILILDEPTAVLTSREADMLFETLNLLCAQGKSIVFISHKLKEILQVAHRITVLRKGRVVKTLVGKEATESELASLMVGEHFSGQTKKKRNVFGKPLLEVRELSALDNRGNLAVENVSFRVREGEIFAVAGVQGNGQSELIEVLTGLREPQSGKFVIDGIDAVGKGPARLFELGLAHIPEDRRAFGMVAGFSLAENLILNRLPEKEFSRFGCLRRKAITKKARHIMKQFDILAPEVQTPVKNLSGGNQQKMVIAREFSKNPRILIAAQPTRGVDIRAAKFVRSQLIRQRERGAAVIVFSTDLDEILSLADTIGVMYRGIIGQSMEAQHADRHRIGMRMAGTDA